MSTTYKVGDRVVVAMDCGIVAGTLGGFSHVMYGEKVYEFTGHKLPKASGLIFLKDILGLEADCLWVLKAARADKRQLEGRGCAMRNVPMDKNI